MVETNCMATIWVLDCMCFFHFIFLHLHLIAIQRLIIFFYVKRKNKRVFFFEISMKRRVCGKHLYTPIIQPKQVHSMKNHFSAGNFQSGCELNIYRAHTHIHTTEIIVIILYFIQLRHLRCSNDNKHWNTIFATVSSHFVVLPIFGLFKWMPSA